MSKDKRKPIIEWEVSLFPQYKPIDTLNLKKQTKNPIYGIHIFFKWKRIQ